MTGATVPGTFTYSPLSGTVLTAVQNTGTVAINGRFSDLPDGGVVDYAYDRQGNLLSVDDGHWALAYEYDPQNRLTAEHQGWGTLRYGYDACGQPVYFVRGQPPQPFPIGRPFMLAMP